jgi:hypothetical protein
LLLSGQIKACNGYDRLEVGSEEADTLMKVDTLMTTDELSPTFVNVWTVVFLALN